MNNNRPWAVEWCAAGEQYGKFHVGHLDRALANNMQVYRHRGQPRGDSVWIILSIWDTHEEAFAHLDELQGDGPSDSGVTSDAS